jgi:exosortase/archaeosortase family protein
MARVTVDSRVRFLIALGGWSVVLLAVVRSPFGQRALVAPFVAWHTAFAANVTGGSPVMVDLSCSGSDVIALSIAAVLAYPVPWRRRLSGVVLASAWLAGLNLVRVMTLAHAAGSSLFLPLHTFVWPAVMIGASVAFVAGWVFVGQPARHAPAVDLARTRRFAVTAALMLIAYVAFTPRLLASEVLTMAALRLASAASGLLRVVGVDALVGGSTLVVGQQAFLVTPECIVTPLMPVYLAWALTWPISLRARIVALLSFAPLFGLLGLVRLLTVALPGIIGPPLFLTHGFYQFVVAFLLMGVAAHWRAHQTHQRGMLQHLTYGLLTAALVAAVLGRPYTQAIDSASRLVWNGVPQTWFPFTPDVQGATAIMPAFQLSLLCGLCVALLGKRAWPSLAVLIPVAAILHAITLIAVRELAGRLGAETPITAVRTASLLTPAILALTATAVHRRTLHQHPAIVSAPS